MTETPRVIEFPGCKWQIKKFIGKGSWGAVWEIIDEIGFKRALKVIYQLDRRDNQKFIAKLKVLKKLKDHRLVDIDKFAILPVECTQPLALDIGEILHDVPYLLMPCGRYNLADYMVLEEHDPLERLHLALQLCMAIHRIHSFRVYSAEHQLRHLTHGHLTLSNIILFANKNHYTLRISDLGIDAQLSIDATPYLTIDNHIPVEDYKAAGIILRELLENISLPVELPAFSSQTWGEWTKELRKYKESLERDKRAQVCIFLGLQLFEKQMYTYALKDFEQAIALDNQLHKAHLYRANTLRELNQYPQAIIGYQRALDINPQDALIYENRGELYGIQKNYQDAIADFKKALQIDPESPSCYGSLGMVYMETKEYQKAVDSFSRLLEFVPDSALAYVDRADSYYALEKYQEALKDYQKALSLEIDSGDQINKKIIELKKLLKIELQK